MTAATTWVSVERPPLERRIALVCDSPHSGRRYPEDFGAALPLAELRSGEDTHIETLWGHAPQVGATLVAAQFPRTYIDPNRGLEDLDAGMLDGPWTQPLAPSSKTALGFGLVWRQVRAGAPVYDRRLGVAEVRRRIDTCWRPYHAALREAVDASVRRFGGCWHLDLHSMPHNAYERLGIVSPVPLADVVLGDRHGTTCDAAFVEVVRRAFESRGYRVAVNDPYEGQELVRLFGQPARGLHSLQVELNRALYMDERTREPGPRFEAVRRDLSGVLEDVAAHVRQATGGPRTAPG
jgi:N-formylglutamate deformylase